MKNVLLNNNSIKEVSSDKVTENKEPRIKEIYLWVDANYKLSGDKFSSILLKIYKEDAQSILPKLLEYKQNKILKESLEIQNKVMDTEIEYILDKTQWLERIMPNIQPYANKKHKIKIKSKKK